MSRVVGFQLKLDSSKVDGSILHTKAGAITEAKEILSYGIAKEIGIVRANDQILLMTIKVKDDEFIEDYR